MTGLLLGIDIGTSSSKGVLVTEDGRIVARAARPHVTSTPRPGWYEHDADAVWDADFRALTHELLAAATAPIAAIGISGIGPCLLPADGGGAPLRPAILYGIDTRAGEQIVRLTDDLGADTIRRRAGAPLTSQAVGPKLLWLRESEPDVYASTKYLFMASSYLVHRLTGVYVLDHHSASQCTPLYDVAEFRWNVDWAEAVAPGLALPELVWPAEVVGRVTAGAAERTGLPEGTPVVAGTIDAWAEATSVGVHAPGDTMIMYGTTLFLIEVVSDLTISDGVWATAGVRPNTWNTAATLPTSGAITTWLSKLTATDFETLIAEAASSPPGANGLLLLPHFEGERTPRFDADMRGALVGLSLAHTRGDIYRAALEGTGFGAREILAAMTAGTDRMSPARIVAVGGGTTGSLWPQIISDVTGLAQELPTETVGACLGDAMLAALGSGVTDDVAAWNLPMARVVPSSAARARYDEMYCDYLALTARTRDVAHRLAAHRREVT